MKETLQRTPEKKNMPIVRIAPVCNGKIYVTPRKESDRWDIPMEDEVTTTGRTLSVREVRRLKEKYLPHVRTGVQPRFSVKYTSRPTKGDETVYLYILPLQSEEDIRFHGGRFVTTDDIQADAPLFSRKLVEESELLGMAAELWEDYYATITITEEC